jgi:alpha,alpha-trehalase
VLRAAAAPGCAAGARGPSAIPTAAAPAAELTGPASGAGLQALRRYIHDAWAPLTRTLAALPAAAVDAKAEHPAGAPWPVYVASDEDPRRIESDLAAVLAPAALATIELRRLPRDPTQDPTLLREPGLLFLPRPYVVPGGRFNEMYGWDSYFILLGLLADGRVDLARDLTDNFLYEVRHYGGVLNANRTYYLTRGQPPFLSEMVLAIYRATGDRPWLAEARAAVVAEHAHWTSPPHLLPDLGLSRYFDHGEGPAPEVVAGERDATGLSHYDRVRAWYRSHEVPDYDLSAFYRRASDQLTPLFFRGDRSMRESGFDPSDRFGPFSVDIIHYAPVCLNTLLFAMETDLAEIDRALGRAADAAAWSELARARRGRIDQRLWDAEAGLYFDFNFQTGRRRRYPFATTFWPLWAGLASPEQAARVRANLPLFERPGGIVTSTRVSGSQWDAPFGWAPLQLFAVDGLRRHGFLADADRVARAFLGMLVDDFARRGTLVEKYDVTRRTSAIGAALQFGYGSNEVGFGWTNGVALRLLDGLERGGRY